MSNLVQFQLKIYENNLNVNKKMTSFWGAKVLFKKIEFEQKVRVFNGKNLKNYENYFANFEKCEKL